jgi:hypothetical protein
MRTLEDEAEHHAKSLGYVGECLLHEEQARDSFIAGANSKYVQAERLKAQIEIIREVLRESDLFDTLIIIKINSLEQQLKQLENETDTN